MFNMAAKCSNPRHHFQIHEEGEPLESFCKQMCRQSSTPDVIPEPLAKGDLALQEVLEADFSYPD